MPPPLFVFFIPGIALFFLIQMVLCHAYHFQVQLTHDRPKMEQKVGKTGQSSQEKADQLENGQPPSNSKGQSDQPQNVNRPKKYKISSNPGSQSESPSELSFITGSSTENKSKRPLSQEPGKNSPPKFQRGPNVSFAEDDQVSYTDVVSHKKARNRRQSVFAESYDPSKDQDDSKVVHPKSADEKKWLTDNLKKVIVFQHLADDQLHTVVDAMFKQPVSEGEQIMKEGDSGNTFFVVQKGVFEVFVKGEDGEHLVKTYNHEGSFGELALLYNQPRAATIIARSDGVLWGVDGQTFRRIVYKITHQKRMMYETLINNVPMLQELEAYERANLVDALTPKSYENEEEIVKQGDEADGMYFIISGGVKVVLLDINGHYHVLNELTNGDYFGELGLITNKPRVASAFSVGSTHLAFLDRDAFERLLGPCMDVMKRNIEYYNERLASLLEDARHGSI